ncbi:FkbM family methyltransferase [Candidatus Nanohalococcus occultus]|uniref:SAM-dependent methyltransferase n=1 Tax=Candidatus Nanohalococcus occultus TaxID=2978047 RepID=A0ABY8CFS6_9ARCH|nr:SAM-dependent methyltransferase [Candidatus Nanohaloarchaeota archaeon SVXNc]
MSLLMKSQRALEEGGLRLLAERSSLFIYRKIMPDVIDVFIEEQGLAIPNGNDWTIVSLPRLEKRRIPVLSEKVAGTRHCSEKHQRLMFSTYTSKEFTDIETSDIVFDVGAYVGGFSIPASKKAKTVIAIDPNSKISDCLSYNTSKFDNISVLALAAWKERDTLEINQSFYPNDNSILAPDENSLETGFKVEADTISNIAKDHNIEKIDFLKIEAEGVEPEILKGALDSDLEIRKIAVNCGPERQGEPTVEETVEMLHSEDYEIKRGSDSEVEWGKWIVFGRKKL